METAEYAIMRAAEERHWWYVGLHDLVLRWARAEARRLGRAPDILDAGCGTGRMAQRLQAVGRVTACDAHPLAIEAAMQRAVPRVWFRNLATDPVGDAAFDLITCLDVLVHRSIPEEAEALRHLRRALRPGGLLILQVAAFDCLRGAHDAAVHGARRYRRGSLRRLLVAAGFKVEFCSYRLPLFFLPLLVRRAASRRVVTRIQPAASSDIAASQLPIVNDLLAALVRIENSLLAAGLRLPVGTSLIVRARKP